MPKAVLILESQESFFRSAVTQTLRGGGGGQSELPPSTSDTIHPIGMIFGTYNKFPF